MALTANVLASGFGWRVQDVICTFGPHDRPFAERHHGVCVAAVTEGTFQYRSTLGSAVLAPGALLLGNDRHAFECRHEHGTGDRCLSFRLTPEFLEGVVAAIPGVRRAVFSAPLLPPQSGLLPIIAAAEAAREDGDAAAFEEVALRLAGAVAAVLAGTKGWTPAPSRRHERQITAALRGIEAQADEPLPLADLAREAAMSPYHFLRSFRALVGMTPHQFVLYTRLNRAAVRLRRTADSISAIAFAAGFNDLSTFNRRFQRIMGLSPRAYRASSPR
jgi:AraC family transcriptional regulator